MNFHCRAANFGDNAVQRDNINDLPYLEEQLIESYVLIFHTLP